MRERSRALMSVMLCATESRSQAEKGEIMFPDTLTERELEAIANAVERGEISARSDREIDSDPLGDPNRVGERIAEGFALINALER